MLVIRRRLGEALLIGQDIEIEILDAGASYVKLGIRAPKSIAVLRKEIKVVSQQNHLAAQEIPLNALERFLPPLLHETPVAAQDGGDV